MSAPGNNRGSSSMDDDGHPPTLSIKLPKMSDLPKKSKPWNDDHLPVDVMLLTVEDCEFLASYYYLRNPFKSYHKSLGFVYFGSMGDEEKPLKVALMRSSDPGGSQTAVKNAVTLLRPKVVYSSGFCSGLNREKAKLGDVVISSKLTTDAYRTPVNRDIGNIIKSAADGWDAPLENPEARDIKVHCDGEILSCADRDSAERQRRLHPDAVALEMEGKGIYLAAHDLKMEWVIVKGVSSFAVNGSTSTDESWKTFACCMAASVISNMLSDSVIFEDWPHYGGMKQSLPHKFQAVSSSFYVFFMQVFYVFRVGIELEAVESRVHQHSTFDVKCSDVISLDKFGKYNYIN
ncbi:5'-methylthioadenosine/S-adenosylhomocysteine nucleosidase-like [Oculina patagonica]